MCGHGSKEICRVENHRATDELVTSVDENGETYKKKNMRERNGWVWWSDFENVVLVS